MTTLFLNHFTGNSGDLFPADDVPGVFWQCSHRFGFAGFPPNFNNDATYASIQSGIGGGFAPSLLQCRYDNISDFIHTGMAVGNGFVLPSTGNFTLECWFRVESDPPYQDSMFMGLGTGPDFAPLYVAAVAVNFFNNSAVFGVQLPSGNYQSTVGVGTIGAGNFYHVAMVRDVSNSTYRLYFNGSLQTTIVSSEDLFGSPTVVHLIGDVDATQSEAVINAVSLFDEIRLTDEVKYGGEFYSIPSPPFARASSTDVFSAEFDWEGKSSGPFVKIIRAQKFLRGWEVRSLPIILNIGSPEFGHEIGSVANTQSQAIRPASSEYGREFDSPRLTDPTFVRGWEAGNAALLQLHNLTTVSLETDWEHDVAHPPHPSDYGWELTSPTYQVIHNVGVETPEMGWEVSTPDTREFAPGITPTNRIFIAGRGSSDRVMVATG